MKRFVVTALGAAIIAALGASSAARAATIDFSVGVADGSVGYIGSSLDVSTTLDLDLSTLVVLKVAADDASGLGLFAPITLSADTSPPNAQIIYTSGLGPLVADVILSWPMVVGLGTDVFTETLTTVTSINRATTDQIGLNLTGTVSDTAGHFMDAPVLLSLTASQAGTTIGVEFTNTSSVGPSIPEPSTWVMMALGFGALGYAASRRRKADTSMLSA